MQKISIVEDVQGKIIKTGWKMLYPGGDLKLTLTLTLSLASGLGLGLTFEKTISIKNLKANAKDEYRQRLLGENLQNLWGWKGLGLGLGLVFF